MAFGTPMPIRAWVAHNAKLAGISAFHSHAESAKLAPRSADDWMRAYSEWMQRPIRT